MLVPAIARKAELEQLFAEHIYDDDMFLYNGYPYCNSIPDFTPKECIYRWAIVDGDGIVGYFTYYIETNSDNVCSFGLYSFDKGNPLIGIDVYRKMKELARDHRRIEWRMIDGNPVKKHYDRFLKKMNGRKVMLKEAVKDARGGYHDEYIYEIVRGDGDESKPET